jgi:phosphohistidine phosphatase SixA
MQLPFDVGRQLSILGFLRVSTLAPLMPFRFQRAELVLKSSQLRSGQTTRWFTAKLTAFRDCVAQFVEELRRLTKRHPDCLSALFLFLGHGQ